MTLLAGRNDVANFTVNQAQGFGGGNGDVVGHVAVASGAGAILTTNFDQFGPNTFIRLAIFEQIGSGDRNLIAQVDVPAGPRPQVTNVPTPINVVAGRTYSAIAYGDDTGSSTGSGAGYVSRNAPVSAPDGTTSTGVGTIEAIPSVYAPGDIESANIMMWNLDDGQAGDITPPSFSVAPAVSSITNDGATLTATIDEPGTIYYVVYPEHSDGNGPSSADVVAGIGLGGLPAIAAGSVSNTTTMNEVVTGLGAAQQLRASIVAEDDESPPNRQSSPVVIAFETLFAAATVSITSGTLAPGQQLTYTTSGLSVATSILLGGQAVIIDSASAGAGTFTVPADIPLAWGESFTLSVSDGSNAATLPNQTLLERSGWDAVDITDITASPTDTESFNEMWELGVGADDVEVNWQLQHTEVPNMTVGPDSVPRIDPDPGTDQSGFFTYFNRNTSTRYAERPFTIERNVGDTTVPVITLSGGANVSVVQNAAFVDPGFSATDDTDGDITANVVVTGTVDTSTLGQYTLSYNVDDAAGNSAVQVQRFVTVVAERGVRQNVYNSGNALLVDGATLAYTAFADKAGMQAGAVLSTGTAVVSNGQIQISDAALGAVGENCLLVFDDGTEWGVRPQVPVINLAA